MHSESKLKIVTESFFLIFLSIPLFLFNGCLGQKSCLKPDSAITANPPTGNPIFSDCIPGFTRDAKVIQAKLSCETEKSSEGNCPENPKERLDERLLDRGGSGRYTSQTLLCAKAQMDAMPEPLAGEKILGLRAGGGIHGWEWLGPGNIGGRIRALVIHPSNPNRMWIGGVSGGIWRTTNGGLSWAPVNDFLPSLAVSCMVMDTDQTNVLYVGTGEGFGSSGFSGGAGVLKSSDSGDTWSQLGQTRGWADVNRIAISPGRSGILLVATATGIYRSLDAGAFWTKVYGKSEHKLVLDVKFITKDQVVAGRGNGEIIYSENGGRTWKQATMNDTDNIFISHLIKDSKTDADNDNNDLLKVESVAGFVVGDIIKIMMNELVTVRKIVDDNTLMVDDLSSDYLENNTVQNTLKGRVELGVGGKNDTVYASIDIGGGTIWRSDDMGKSFTLVGSPEDTPNFFVAFGDRNRNSQGEYDNAIWVSPNDSEFIVVGGIDLWRSTTGGTNFEKISDWLRYHVGASAHADQHCIMHHPFYDGDRNKAVFVVNDGGIQRTDDIKGISAGSLNWVNLAHNLGITQFYHGSADPSGSVVVGGCQDNGNIKLESGHGTDGWWQCADCTGDGGFCAVNYNDPDVIYTSIQHLEIFKSTNRGDFYLPATFRLDEARNASQTRFIAPFSMHPEKPDVLVAGGTKIWRTDDGAKSWLEIRGAFSGKSIPVCSTIEISKGNSYQIWAGYVDGTVSKDKHITIGGISSDTWENVDDNGFNPLPNDRVVTDIAINPLNINEVFVTLGESRNGLDARWRNVWFTNDNGETWQERRGTGVNALPAVHINTITFHPVDPNMVYVGTDIGVFTSNDKGLTWQKTTDGPVYTEIEHLFWQGRNLIAATYGRGMWRTKPVLPIYVDWRNTGYEDGTYAYPYNTIKEALDAAWNYATIIIMGGDYNESGDVVIDGSVELKARGEIVIH